MTSSSKSAAVVPSIPAVVNHVPRTLHLICQAHLDPVWLWPWQDGCAEALTTISSAADRMAENPAMRFTRSSASVYRWIKEIDPHLFSTIRRHVKNGRWEVIGGQIEQPDCNLPSTESMVRQSLYAQRWLAREVGRRAEIGYNVDSFGHGGGFPQLLLQSGLREYVFMRPQKHEAPNLPDLFWWEGADGSRILAQRVPGEYSQPPNTTAAQLEARLRETYSQHFSPGFDDGIFWLGIGNHGGGPTREHLALIRRLQTDPSLPELRFSTVGEYFQAIRNSPGFRNLPVFRGELQHHARGCYSAHGETKALHRRAEQALFSAESVASLAAVGGIGNYPEARLEEAWWYLLFNQFHDILGGSCVAAVWPDTRNAFGATIQTAREVAVSSAFRIARRVDTRGEHGSVVFAFNPLPWRRTALVQLDTFRTPHGREEITHLQERDGTQIPLQWLPAEANFGPHLMEWGKLTAAIDLPAGGYRVVRCGTGTPPKIPRLGSHVSLASRRAGLAKLPTPDGVEILKDSAGLIVVEDKSDTWGHGVKEFEGKAQRPALLSRSVLVDGPLVRIERQTAHWQNSEIRLDVVQCAHSPLVELRFRFNWQEKRQLLVLEIPTRLVTDSFASKVAGGVAERATDGEEQPCQDWVALSGHADKTIATLAVINAGSYSVNAKDGRLRFILARSAPYAEHAPMSVDADAVHLDQGWQERNFWLLAADGTWSDLSLDRCAAECQQPPEVMLDSVHSGTEPWAKSFLEVMPKNLSVTAVKQAEDDESLVVRVQEMAGRKTEGQLTILGEKINHDVSFKPWEIKTLRCAKSGSGISVSELNFLEEEPYEVIPNDV